MCDEKPQSNVHYLFPRKGVAKEKPPEQPAPPLEFDFSQLVAPYPMNQATTPEQEKWGSWLINFLAESGEK
ncbi:hypothetical protein K2Q00_02945 [Patescibacteria group bacterium]|nr:hypothetical protein [Patescibacteria group bacterium]